MAVTVISGNRFRAVGTDNDQTITGRKVFQAGSATAVPLTIMAASGQTANVLEIKDSSGTIVSSTSSSGRQSILGVPGGTGQLDILAASAYGSIYRYNKIANPPAATIVGRDIYYGLNSVGATVAYADVRGAVSVNTDGAEDGYWRLYTLSAGTVKETLRVGESVGQVYIPATSATAKALVLRNAANQTANLAEFQNSAGAVLSGIDSTGKGIGALASSQVDVITASGTWTKPAGAKSHEVFCFAGGGGGAGGSASYGGGGGGGGEFFYASFVTDALTSTVSVTVGAGGTAGASLGAGAAGGDSSFGTYLVSHGGDGAIAVSSTGGTGANGGGTSLPASGVLSLGHQSTRPLAGAPGLTNGSGEYGGGAGSYGRGNTISVEQAGGSSLYGGGGGGGGGQSTNIAGSYGGKSGAYLSGGGAAPGSAGANVSGTGRAGEGGGGAAMGAGQTGKAGGIPSGGGGGGNPNSAGAAGGRGEIIVITHF